MRLDYPLWHGQARKHIEANEAPAPHWSTRVQTIYYDLTGRLANIFLCRDREKNRSDRRFFSERKHEILVLCLAYIRASVSNFVQTPLVAGGASSTPFLVPCAHALHAMVQGSPFGGSGGSGSHISRTNGPILRNFSLLESSLKWHGFDANSDDENSISEPG